MRAISGILKTRRNCVPTTWTLSTNHTFPVAPSLSGDNLIRRVKYHNGYWVMVGVKSISAAGINYATDPSGAWLDPASYSTPPIDTKWGDIANDGTYWVTSNDRGYFNYISGNPSGSWVSDYTYAPGGRGCLEYGNGYWSIAAQKYSTSITGPWSSSTGVSLGAVNAIRYGADGYWVAGRGDNQYYWALNTPINFTHINPGPFVGVANIFGVEYGNGYWVMVSNHGEIAYSTDPSVAGSWTVVAGPWGGSPILNVAYANGTWIIVGGVGGAPGTARLATQSLVPTGSWDLQTLPYATGDLYGIAYGNGYWVATGRGGTLMYSKVC